MSRFQKISQKIWHCQYHIVWVPKYRYRVLSGAVATEVSNYIRAFSEQKDCKIVELNVHIDHVHLLVMVPLKVSISDYVGIRLSTFLNYVQAVGKSIQFQVA